MRRELWEYPFPIKVKEVRHRRKKYKTKSQLVEQINRKEERMSPKIDTEVREGADDVIEGIPYEIVNVEDIVTDVQNLSGIRVEMLNQKAEEGNVVLWKRRITGSGSKLGVFITVLGSNTDTWIHKWVKFNVWKERQREIEVVPAPAPSKPKARTKK